MPTVLIYFKQDCFISIGYPVEHENRWIENEEVIKTVRNTDLSSSLTAGRLPLASSRK